MNPLSSTPIDDEVMALPYAEVIAQDRLERWEAGARIASTTTVTGDEYKLAKAYLELLSKQSEIAPSVPSSEWRYSPIEAQIYSAHFTNDAALHLTGDFEDDEQKTAYAEKLCALLNSTGVQSANTSIDVATALQMSCQDIPREFAEHVDREFWNLLNATDSCIEPSHNRTPKT